MDGLITCVCFLTDDILVSANDNGTLRIWKRGPSQAGKAFSFALVGVVEIS